MMAVWIPGLLTVFGWIVWHFTDKLNCLITKISRRLTDYENRRSPDTVSSSLPLPAASTNPTKSLFMETQVELRQQLRSTLPGTCHVCWQSASSANSNLHSGIQYQCREKLKGASTSISRHRFHVNSRSDSTQGYVWKPFLLSVSLLPGAQYDFT